MVQRDLRARIGHRRVRVGRYEQECLRSEPAGADPWDLGKVAHLHRRAGFGATWADLQRDLKAGPAASVDRLVDAPKPTAEQEDIIAQLEDVVASVDPAALKVEIASLGKLIDQARGLEKRTKISPVTSAVNVKPHRISTEDTIWP